MSYPIPYHPSWDILDPSKIQDQFLPCKRRYLWRNMLGWTSDRSNNHLVFGEAWHSAMAHLLTQGYGPQQVEGAYEAFLSVYRREFPSETDELFTPKTPDNAFKALCLYTGKYHQDLEEMEILHTEIAISVPISSTRVLHGRMDVIYRRRSEDLYAADDHKTRQGYIDTRWNEQWTGSFQMNTYTHALYCLFPIDKVKGLRVNAVAFPKTKVFNPDINRDFVRVPCYRSPQYMQNWLWLANSIYDELEFELERFQECKEDDPILMAFPQNPTSCSDFFGCPYLDFCFTWRNPIQVQDRLPTGMKIEFWNPLERPFKERMELKWPDGR